ncbi:glycosyltransferase [Bifidobacterium sp. ESL0800]|uniref:glycosyltransferase family 2 protein n=1 Tax=Bifidobacterium sp. ESL0800 TaxID=2983236 RepID=UPI0023F8F28D|nr:glycosyltransferase [Bifidobacterium sp. ESL0800]WEV75636.1 glycosyltransferase [Bifidobacterium sp. ESL0800]
MDIKSSSDEPLVSVIIPAFNVEEYISNCLTNVLEQTYSNLQIIVVDDGSTDTTGLICDKWSTRDPRITVVHEKNRGLSGARNHGVSKAIGEYILFLDADDTLDPETIASTTALAASSNSELISFDVQPIDISSGNKLSRSERVSPNPFPICQKSTGKECLKFIHAGNLPNLVQTFLYKGTLFYEKGFTFPEEIRFLEDVAFVNHEFDKINTVAYIQKRFYRYACNRSDSLTNTKDIKSITNAFNLIISLSHNRASYDSDYINYLLNLLFYTETLLFNSNDFDKKLDAQMRKEIHKIAPNYLLKSLSKRNLVKVLLTTFHLFRPSFLLYKHLNRH